jgi:uncharacterized protein (DUF3084 family)
VHDQIMHAALNRSMPPMHVLRPPIHGWGVPLAVCAWLGVCAAAAAVFGAGYMVGHREVEALKAQIQAIKSEGEDAEARRKKSQEEIARVLREKDAEFAKQAQQLQADADRKAKDLAVALADANNRVKSLKAQLSSMDAKRAQLVAERDSASAAEREKLQERIDTLDREKQVLIARVDANECLALAVPEAVIEPLVRRN